MGKVKHRQKTRGKHMHGKSRKPKEGFEQRGGVGFPVKAPRANRETNTGNGEKRGTGNTVEKGPKEATEYRKRGKAGKIPQNGRHYWG